MRLCSYVQTGVCAWLIACSFAACGRPAVQASGAEEQLGVSGEAPSPDPVPEGPLRFRYAVLLKPKEVEVAPSAKAHLPLISIETKHGPKPHDSKEFGSELRQVNPAVPWTVYAGTGRCTIAGKPHEQAEYLWCSPRSGPGDGPTFDVSEAKEPTLPPGNKEVKACPSPRGLRITLGEDGFAIAWELVSAEGDHIVYVSESLERRAAVEFGGPLPGRRHAVERAANETAGVLVTGVLPDGPVPMGPYVYLGERPDFDFQALACRCSPSLVQEFVNTGYYEVKPLDAAPANTVALREWMRRPGELDRILRWPRS